MKIVYLLNHQINISSSNNEDLYLHTIQNNNFSIIENAIIRKYIETASKLPENSIYYMIDSIVEVGNTVSYDFIYSLINVTFSNTNSLSDDEKCVIFSTVSTALVIANDSYLRSNYTYKDLDVLLHFMYLICKGMINDKSITTLFIQQCVETTENAIIDLDITSYSIRLMENYIIDFYSLFILISQIILELKL